MKLSIVTTLYYSSAYIVEFHRRVSAAARQLVGDDYEVIFVNDGSPDDSLEIAVSLLDRDSRVKVIDLSRNFGHHKAMMTGLEATKGQRVFLIDVDLEEEPEWLLRFATQMETEMADVVYGTQSKRRGKWFERFTGRLFYRVFRLLTGIAQPNNITTARLMSRRYVEALLLHRERELNIGGLWLITGFKQSHQMIHKHATSPTSYSFSKKISHLVNSVTSFSSVPLMLTFYFGLFVSISALGYIVYLVIRYWFIAVPPDGYTSIIASICLFSGLIIFFIGVQGIYLAKIFLEVKQRPYTIVRQIYSQHKEVCSS